MIRRIPASPGVEYIGVDSCPSCHCKTADQPSPEPLAIDAYYWGQRRISTWHAGRRIGVICCSQCGLYYKDAVPSPEYLGRLIAELDADPWVSDYNYEREKLSIATLINSPFDVIDVGAGQGGFLRALGGMAARRSALDFVRYERCAGAVSGEYLLAEMESTALTWSGMPYDVATMFDVAEHMYNVNAALANVARLVRPGGYLFIQTGDAHSALPREYGIGEWWYLNLLEHHVAFSTDSLSAAVTRAGFRSVRTEHTRHKGTMGSELRVPRGHKLRRALYALSPTLYRAAARAVAVNGNQPADPASVDHLWAAFERV